MGYNPNIPHLYVGYNPFTNHLLTSWDIQVKLHKTQEVAKGKRPFFHTMTIFSVTIASVGSVLCVHGEANTVPGHTEVGEGECRWKNPGDVGRVGGETHG